MSELKVEQLSYQPGKHAREILTQISTVFEEGKFYGILGPNGSGKTTLIRHLLGLLSTQKGSIQLEEKNIWDYHKKELAGRISFVPQNTYLEADFSVYDIVAMGRTPYLKRFESLSSEEEKLIEEAMQITNTYHMKEKRFNQLSGGEAQRVLVARAIAQDTPWMILDEPISHLDIKHQVELMETLKRLNEEKGKTIIAILHDLNLTSAYCSQVVLMKKGSIYAAGDTKEVLSKENLKAVYDLEFEIQTLDEYNRTYYVPMFSKF